MEILGIGPSEFIFVVIIALIILGPKDMQKAGKTIGKWLRSIVTSDGWKVFQQTSRELRTLPNRLMREANDEVNKIGNEINNSASPSTRRDDNSSSWMRNPNIPSRSMPVSNPPTPASPPENSIAPTEAASPPTESDQPKDA
ncbi:MAG: twin-arginine translocase TatA/TatE family subunit [Chloroflexi bacterium]|nr:twin-arginine translocase TatA/TatE family subunit [Chloroflexota bacterium]